MATTGVKRRCDRAVRREWKTGNGKPEMPNRPTLRPRLPVSHFRFHISRFSFLFSLLYGAAVGHTMLDGCERNTGSNSSGGNDGTWVQRSVNAVRVRSLKV